MGILFLYLKLFCILSSVICWDLSDFGLNEDYYVSSVAVYFNRAFLAIPRNICNNNVSSATMVEVPWNENFNVFGVRNNKILKDQEWGVCENLQNVVALAMEPRKPKLWILDKGNEHCPAKIAMYNLLHNSLGQSSELNNIPADDLAAMVIDPVSGNFGQRAYIGNAGKNTLLVFSLNDLKWWKVNLMAIDHPLMLINVDYLTVSKIDPILYITGRNTTEAFSLELEYIRNDEGPLPIQAEDVFTKTNVTMLGHKLGISSGLESDFKNGLSYYLVRDYAIVRWLIGNPMQAEYHNVLAQSYETLPYVSQLFTGPQNGIWALVNPLSPEDCKQINNTVEDIVYPKKRIVKILKYNKFDLF